MFQGFMHHDLTLLPQSSLCIRDAMYREWGSTPNVDYLKCLNSAELLDLLEDDDRIHDIVRVNSKLWGLQKSKVVLLASNYWLAKQNLTYQPYLSKTKLLLAEKHQDLRQLVSSIQCKQRMLETLQKRFNLQVLHMFLKEKISESIRESKTIWQTFMEGKLLLTDFMESLQNAQKLYHKRLVQAEKIQDLIRQTQIHERDVSYVHHLNPLHTPNTITVFGGISSVILLPGLQFPHVQTSYLSPVRHQGSADSCVKSNNKSCDCKCPETHRRHFSLQPLEKHRNPK